MNYIRQLNAFRDWAMINRPSTGVVALWHSLMSVANMTGWQTWFTAPNATLQLMTGLSRQGLDAARGQLIDKFGLIEYSKGRSNQAGRYRVKELYADIKNLDVNSECKNLGTVVDTEVGTAAAFEQAHQRRDSSTLYKLNKTKLKDNNRRARGEIFTIWQSKIGPIGGLLVDKINDLMDTYPAEWIVKAIGDAEANNARNFTFVDRCLKNRHRQEAKGGTPCGTDPGSDKPAVDNGWADFIIRS